MLVKELQQRDDSDISKVVLMSIIFVLLYGAHSMSLAVVADSYRIIMQQENIFDDDKSYQNKIKGFYFIIKIYLALNHLVKANRGILLFI